MCKITWCSREIKARGLCGVHYARERRGTNPHAPIKRNFVQRFWAKVNTDQEGCWVWQGATTNKGYGRLKSNGKNLSAHRVVFQLHFGYNPNEFGLNVCHHCDNPPCVRPDHLFVGTQSENMEDAVSKGRVKTPDGRSFQSGHNPANRNLSGNEAYNVKRALKLTDLTIPEIAQKFDVPEHTVADISAGRAYI